MRFPHESINNRFISNLKFIRIFKPILRSNKAIEYRKLHCFVTGIRWNTTVVKCRQATKAIYMEMIYNNPLKIKTLLILNPVNNQGYHLIE